jgi:colanic acid/amylovoran biosynthesis glycosyltransferase
MDDSTATFGADRSAQGHRIAYFASRFPTTTETFVVRELNAVAGRPGIEADLYALFPTPPGVVQQSARTWIDRVHRVPPAGAVMRFARWACRRPLRVASTLAIVVREHHRRPRVLLRSLVAFMAAVWFADTLRALETDHIHAHFASYPAFAAWVCHRLTGIPYSFTAHAHDLYVHDLAIRRKARDASFVVAISEFNRRLLGELAPDGAPVHVVHCGVDVNAYPFVSHAPPSSGPVHALIVGSLREKKGHRVLFDALAHGGPGLDRIELDLVGDGPLRAELEEHASRLGLSHRVRFHGDLTENAVVSMLARADLFVLPSVIERSGDTEGIPVALMEAMAAGVPVIGSRVAGVPELVVDGQTGLLVEPGDARDLADRLSQMLQDPAAAQARAGAGRKLVEREFSLDSSAARLAALFTDGLAEGATASGREHRAGSVLSHA